MYPIPQERWGNCTVNLILGRIPVGRRPFCLDSGKKWAPAIKEEGMSFLRWLKWYKVLGLAVIVAMAVTFAACSKGEQEEAGAKEEMSGAMEAAEEFVDEQRKEAVGALQGAYDEFSQKFEEFKQRNAFVFSETKRNLVSDIEDKQGQIEQQLLQARAATEEVWEQLKTDITAAMEELEQAMVDFES
jgi:hypothetical protein